MLMGAKEERRSASAVPPGRRARRHLTPELCAAKLCKGPVVARSLFIASGSTNFAGGSTYSTQERRDGGVSGGP